MSLLSAPADVRRKKSGILRTPSSKLRQMASRVFHDPEPAPTLPPTGPTTRAASKRAALGTVDANAHTTTTPTGSSHATGFFGKLASLGRRRSRPNSPGPSTAMMRTR